MRRAMTAAVPAAAVAGFGFGASRRSSSRGRAKQPPKGNRSRPAPRTAQDVPVKVVVLFSSGVGHFEHFGTVRGDGSTELRFKTQQINDILKSLVLQDLDGGKVAARSPTSARPRRDTLRSFQWTSSNSTSPSCSTSSARRSAWTTDAAENLSGTILGVEKKQRPVGKGDDSKPVEVAVLNLLTGAASGRSRSTR